MKLPLGYRYAAAYAGIRKQERDDVGLIVSDQPAAAAAIFTQNMVQAAPVRLARKHLKASGGTVSAILVNAGNANCATRTGDRVAMASCKAVARALPTKTRFVLPASTGVIGVELDPAPLTGVVPKLAGALSPDGFEAVAQAILTTDTRMKVASEEVSFRTGKVRVAGMTKGSGMIQPNMATTLGFVLTDAEVAPPQLAKMLAHANTRSYGSLTVDGDTSTNDMVALLANKASGVKPDQKERKVLEELVTWVMESLAEQIAADGEGAKKLIRIVVSGFDREDEAHRVARAIANSPLVKTAVAGSDPNWGRILTAAGYAGVPFDPRDIDICLQSELVCRRGLAVDFEEAALKQKLDSQEVSIHLKKRGSGAGEARFFTCDLTEGYIHINGSYRT
ncbi:MAG TPA: bifunctional glutamate N-acetyltransferase/amino-acid acetyltransferase ArgJ [Bryobacteraceae bacterium]|nr:bifunctional glutamate N-acetyltransferase/amino-acid acetyltransferase ArgJ [Bryobacteraceae bacterium]